MESSVRVSNPTLLAGRRAASLEAVGEGEQDFDAADDLVLFRYLRNRKPNRRHFRDTEGMKAGSGTCNVDDLTSPIWAQQEVQRKHRKK